MKWVPFVAGLAVGYVFGTRAGREKYEQIAENARQLYADPTPAAAWQAVRNVTVQPSASSASSSSSVPSTPSKVTVTETV